ncbi:hypothetical protein [Lapillicoccus sp.]|uniref:hypothetical protein n=1 Tax=Lapillicoccus sp. TaxID=1909287 RepID=UPI0027D1405F|nr:hypothetical protein [Actinomycetota bacterium]
MIDAVVGDPASCSELGGSLRSHAAQLLPQRQELAERLQGSAGGRLEPALTGPAQAYLALLDTTIDRLDEAGACLQRYAQDLAEVVEAVRRLEDAARAAGLELDGLRVVEPWGVLSTELAERRHRVLPELQQWADRLASQLGRARGVLQHAMRDGTAALALAADTGRAGLGR